MQDECCKGLSGRPHWLGTLRLAKIRGVRRRYALQKQVCAQAVMADVVRVEQAVQRIGVHLGATLVRLICNDLGYLLASELHVVVLAVIIFVDELLL